MTTPAGASVSLSRIYRSEDGKTLPLALITLAVGAALVASLVGHVSSRMLGLRDTSQKLQHGYAADAGIEYAIWKLANDPSYRAQVQAGTDPILTTSVNNLNVTVDSLALPQGQWIELAEALDSVGSGAALAAGEDGRVYAIRGANTVQAWRYTPDGSPSPGAGVWSDFAVNDTPASVSGGGDLIHTSGDQFYALRGAVSNDFWGYESGSNSWDSGVGSFAGGAGDGAALVYSGPNNTMYALRGSGTTAFRRYRFGGGGPGPPPGWIGAPEAPGPVQTGGALEDANGLIYAFPGGSPILWLFDPAAGAAGSWASGSGDPADAPAAVGAGAALAWDGGDYVYALRGAGTSDFWRYSLSGDTWEAMASTPAPVGAGGDLERGSGGLLYAFQGGLTAGFWVFEITPPRFEITATTGSTTTSSRIELSASAVTVLLWDIE